MLASGYVRAANDFYQEPRWAIDALLDAEEFRGSSWDPSCGEGNIPTAMRARGLPCRGSDKVDRGFTGAEVVDFFEASDRADNIVSNPPYGVMEAYIGRALSLTTGKVAILARLALLEGVRRREFFRTTPLARVWVSSRRISRPPGGTTVEARGGAIAYAWFVWSKGHEGPPTVGWLDDPKVALPANTALPNPAATICLARVAAQGPDGCGGGAIGHYAIGEPGGCPECQAEAALTAELEALMVAHDLAP